MLLSAVVIYEPIAQRGKQFGFQRNLCEIDFCNESLMKLRRGAWSCYRQGTASRGCRSPVRELIVFHSHVGAPDGRARTLYDLIGASPDDDTEGLKEAFYKAVKANHPDLHPDDPDATVRLSGIVRAYAILRDAHERTSYDQALELEGASLRPKPKRFRTIHRIFAEAGKIGALTVALSAGYVLIANVSQFFVDSKVSEVRGPLTITTVELARQRTTRGSTTEDDELNKQPVGVTVTNMTIKRGPAAAAAKSNDAVEVANAQPVEAAEAKPAEAGKTKLAPAAPEGAVNGVVEKPGAASDQPEALIASDQSKRSHEVDPPDQESKPTPSVAPPVRVKFSSLANDDTIQKSSSPDLSASERKHHAEPLDSKSQNAKSAKLTARERPRTAETRLTTSDHASAKRASLEDMCSENQSCSGKSAPLLGLGV
jgi:curved DNA-binding protein CbpA